MTLKDADKHLPPGPKEEEPRMEQAQGQGEEQPAAPQDQVASTTTTNMPSPPPSLVDDDQQGDDQNRAPSQQHSVFTREDENRMHALTEREAKGEDPLNEDEKEELKALAERYQVFLDEGERALKAGVTPEQASSSTAAGGLNLRSVVEGTSNAFISAGKATFFWGTLVATAVPGYLGKKSGVIQGWDHWNWLSNKLILGALPVVTSVGNSGNHLEQLKQQLEKRKMKLGLVVACLEQQEMKGYGVGVLHFATQDRWKEVFGLEDYEHCPMPDMGACVTYEAVKHAVDRMHETMHVKNEVVYVHCKAGKGRSWMVVMCYLLTYGGMDWNTADVTVKSGRHQVNPGHAQRAFAQEFARRFNAERDGCASLASSTVQSSSTLNQ